MRIQDFIKNIPTKHSIDELNKLKQMIVKGQGWFTLLTDGVPKINEVRRWLSVIIFKSRT